MAATGRVIASKRADSLGGVLFRHVARPASATGGQPWALERIKAGDTTCQANQALHGEAANLIAKLRANAHYVPSRLVLPVLPGLR